MTIILTTLCTATATTGTTGRCTRANTAIRYTGVTATRRHSTDSSHALDGDLSPLGALLPEERPLGERPLGAKHLSRMAPREKPALSLSQLSWTLRQRWNTIKRGLAF